MESEFLIVAGIGVFLLVACTLIGWAIVRTGFQQDRVRDEDPDAVWRGQMKATAAASGAMCVCPPAPTGSAGGAHPDGVLPDPECPIHRWDLA